MQALFLRLTIGEVILNAFDNITALFDRQAIIRFAIIKVKIRKDKK